MGVRRDGDQIIITMPVAQALSLRVALDGVPPNACEATGSRDLRKALSKAIGRAVAAGAMPGAGKRGEARDDD